MLSDALVISLSRNFWDDVWRSRHQVMSRLAATNTVVFASRPLNVAEALPWVQPRSPLRAPGVHRIDGNLYAYVPPRHLPTILRFPAVDRILNLRRMARLRRLAERLNGRRRVLYLWHPSFEPYIDLFPDATVCYHLFDDLSLYGGRSDGATAAALERIFARADVVFAASEELADRYHHFGNVHWVPNGVDDQAYAAAVAADVPCPPDLEPVPHPRLGYTGTLRAQIDVELLTSIAQSRPDWHLVLIGDVSRGMSESDEYRRLRDRPNVHALGSKGADQMPHYLLHLDAGLLPYRLDGAAKYCYPLKMHEYLAAGLPVVSSALPAALRFDEVIRIADTPGEWISAIDAGLANGAPAAVRERRQIARENSWDARVARISDLIERKLR